MLTQSCSTICNPMDCTLSGSSVHRDSPGNNTGMCGHALLQGIFPTWGSNPGRLHCRQILYHLSHQGSPRILAWVAYPFSRGSSLPRNWTGVSCIAGRFFISWATREAHLEDKSMLLATYWSELWILELVVREHLSPLGNKVFYLNRVTLDLILIFIIDFHQ